MSKMRLGETGKKRGRAGKGGAVGAAGDAAGEVMNAALPVVTGSRGISPTLISMNAGVREMRLRGRERWEVSRFLQEKLPFVLHLTETIPAEAVGRGMGVKSVSKDAGFAAAATGYFAAWADSGAVDLRKKGSFFSMQGLWLSALVGDGEVFVQKVAATDEAAREWSLGDKERRRLQLQTFTRDQVRTLGRPGPEEDWEEGILFNAFNQPVSYRVATGGKRNDGSYQDIPAGYMWHGLRRLGTMPNARHGVPWLFCGEEDVLDALDLKAVRTYAAKVKSAFLGATVTGDGGVPRAVGEMLGKVESAPGVDSGQRYAQIFGGAVVLPLARGEDVKWFNGQEAMDYGALIESLLSPLVWGFGYPPEYLFGLKGLTGPAMRGVLDRVRKGHERLRGLLAPLLEWVWRWVVGDAMLDGPLREWAGLEDWAAVELVADPDPSIDLGRDEKAEQERIRTFTGTIDDYVEKRTGGSGRAVRHKRIDEIADNIAYGKSKDLPWFLCVDAQTLYALSAVLADPEQFARIAKIIEPRVVADGEG